MTNIGGQIVSGLGIALWREIGSCLPEKNMFYGSSRSCTEYIIVNSPGIERISLAKQESTQCPMGIGKTLAMRAGVFFGSDLTG